MHGGTAHACKVLVAVQHVSDVAASALLFKLMPYSVALVGQAIVNSG